SWPGLLQECRRILRPGGILRLTECEVSLSSSPSVQRMMGLLSQALWKQGRTFSADGQSLGMVHRLGKLMLDAGFQDLQLRAFVIDSSAYQPWSYHVLKTVDVTFSPLKPYLLAAGMIEAQAFDDLQQQMLIEMLAEAYTCLTFGLTVWAHTPAEP